MSSSPLNISDLHIPTPETLRRTRVAPSNDTLRQLERILKSAVTIRRFPSDTTGFVSISDDEDDLDHQTLDKTISVASPFTQRKHLRQSDQRPSTHPQVDVPQLDPPRVDPPQIDVPRVDIPRVGASRLEGLRLEGSRVGGSRLEGSRVGGSRLEGSRVGGSRLRIDGSRLDRPRVSQSRDLRLDAARRERLSTRISRSRGGSRFEGVLAEMIPPGRRRGSPAEVLPVTNKAEVFLTARERPATPVDAERKVRTETMSTRSTAPSKEGPSLFHRPSSVDSLPLRPRGLSSPRLRSTECAWKHLSEKSRALRVAGGNGLRPWNLSELNSHAPDSLKPGSLVLSLGVLNSDGVSATDYLWSETEIRNLMNDLLLRLETSRIREREIQEQLIRNQSQTMKLRLDLAQLRRHRSQDGQPRRASPRFGVSSHRPKTAPTTNIQLPRSQVTEVCSALERLPRLRNLVQHGASHRREQLGRF